MSFAACHPNPRSTSVSRRPWIYTTVTTRKSRHSHPLPKVVEDAEPRLREPEILRSIRHCAVDTCSTTSCSREISSLPPPRDRGPHRRGAPSLVYNDGLSGRIAGQMMVGGACDGCGELRGVYDSFQGFHAFFAASFGRKQWREHMNYLRAS